MIQIVNWLLTRKCNLRCDYCRIIKDYKNKPLSYPSLTHYFNREMSTDYVLQTLSKIKKHNPGAFHIFYGGEPFLRKDLWQIINFCNVEDIHYTIITNNTESVQPAIENLIEKCGTVKGLTSSVDPLILDPLVQKTDRYKKSMNGLGRLCGYKDKINDLVAEITVDKYNIKYLYDLVKLLTDKGICSSITAIDISKNLYYDFSNVDNTESLLQKTPEVKEIFEKITNSNLNVHMKDTVLPNLYNILPANLDCGIDNDIHNMTIDADGSARLCLRIRGVMTPNIRVYDCIHDDGSLHFSYKEFIKTDKRNYCEGCNWTCMEMSKNLNVNLDTVDNLIHKDIRYD